MFTRTIFLAILMALVSCSNREQNQPQQPDPPKALQENKSSSFSVKEYRGKDDLVKDLYKELLEKDSMLQKLEAQLDELRKSEDDSTSAFTLFDGKNKSYHSTASDYVSRISDTLLRERIKNILGNSLSRYEQATANQQNLLQRISENKTRISDLHTAVQLVSSLELMEKYRKDNMPASASLQGFIRQQDQAKQMAEQKIK
jgi:hypothetical protein